MKTKEMMAMKVIEIMRAVQKNLVPQVKKEISIMKRLKHPNVIQVKDVMASKTKIFIIMEYVKRGDLGSALKSKGF